MQYKLALHQSLRSDCTVAFCAFGRAAEGPRSLIGPGKKRTSRIEPPLAQLFAPMFSWSRAAMRSCKAPEDCPKNPGCVPGSSSAPASWNTSAGTEAFSGTIGYAGMASARDQTHAWQFRQSFPSRQPVFLLAYLHGALQPCGWPRVPTETGAAGRTNALSV